MKKMAAKDIKKIKKLISKMKMNKPNIKNNLKPIYDDIYFAGLEYLDGSIQKDKKNE